MKSVICSVRSSGGHSNAGFTCSQRLWPRGVSSYHSFVRRPSNSYWNIEVCISVLLGYFRFFQGYHSCSYLHIRAGGVIKFIPSPLIAGFIGGIGALIISNECSRALGVVNQPGTSLAGTLMATSDPFTTLISLINPGSLLLAGVTVFTALAIAKRYPKYPAIMVSVAVATLLQTIFQLPGVQMIGELPASLPAPSLPAIPQLSDMTGIGLYSLLFVCLLPNLINCVTDFLFFYFFAPHHQYGVASMESLLSAAALDKLSKAKEPHDANQELVGQGIGNVTCSMFGGLLATSVIVRSSLSVIAGAKTRRAALVHSAMLMAAVYLASVWFAAYLFFFLYLPP